MNHPDGPLSSALLHKIEQGAPGLCLYGLAPPKRAIEPAQLAEVVAQHERRFAELSPELDGLVVYDIQDESVRTDQPRPFPFLPTIEPERYAYQHLGRVRAPKIVYRSVGQASRAEFQRWLAGVEGGPGPRFAVLVGAPSAYQRGDGLQLAEAYALARGAARLVLGGIAIAERHGRRLDEHLRMLSKMDQGCRFFVTQAVYDVTSTKSLLSDYALRLAEVGRRPAPVILTFAPCGSARTLEFMKWLGIPRLIEAFPLGPATQVQDGLAALFAPAHAALLESLGDKGLARRLCYAGPDGQSLGLHLRVLHALAMLSEVLKLRIDRRGHQATLRLRLLSAVCVAENATRALCALGRGGSCGDSPGSLAPAARRN